MSLTCLAFGAERDVRILPLGFQVITGWQRFARLPNNDPLPMQTEVPILEQGRYLIATVPGEVTDGELVELRDSLVDRVKHSHSNGVIVDVSDLDVIDSFVARTLQDLAKLTGRRGAPTVVVGIQPEVAHAMEKVGLTLDNTAGDLAEGLAQLDNPTR